jgi:hypothetical protein
MSAPVLQPVIERLPRRPRKLLRRFDIDLITRMQPEQMGDVPVTRFRFFKLFRPLQ